MVQQISDGILQNLSQGEIVKITATKEWDEDNLQKKQKND